MTSIYWTSRKLKAGLFTYNVKSGWVYKVDGKESKRIYEYRKDAEYAMNLEILAKKNLS